MSEVPERIRLRAVDPSLIVTIRLGKSGLTEAVFKELDSQLGTRELVKAKVNRGLAETAEERRQVWDSLAATVGATLVLMRGNVAVFWRK
tara:strand:+ start:224 stop:493 length:270 start_codon:yes stop_codon:yes gene_type:complete